jgi:hypothetical protein
MPRFPNCFFPSGCLNNYVVIYPVHATCPANFSLPHLITQMTCYVLHGAESFLRSCPVFAASQIPRIFMEPEGSLPYSQVPATRPYPEPTPSSPHDPLQLPEDPS